MTEPVVRRFSAINTYAPKLEETIRTLSKLNRRELTARYGDERKREDIKNLFIGISSFVDTFLYSCLLDISLLREFRRQLLRIEAHEIGWVEEIEHILNKIDPVIPSRVELA